MDLDAQTRGEHPEIISDLAVENLLGLWIFAVVFAVASVAIVWPIVTQAWRTHDNFRLLSLVFPAVGAGLLIWAIVRSLRAQKFGMSALRLVTFPAQPGADLAGTIHVARPVVTTDPMQLTLLCINRITQMTSHRQSVYERVIWRETSSLDSLPSVEQGTNIPVMFHLPGDSKPSDNTDMLSIILWRLEAKCHTAGLDYFSRFEISVSIKHGVQPAPAARARTKLTEAGIFCEPLAGNALLITIAPAHQRSEAIGPATVGIVLTSGAVALALWPAEALVRIITIALAAFILFIGCVFDYIALYKWFVGAEISARRGSLTIQLSVATFNRQTTYASDDLSEIGVGIEGKSEIRKNKSPFSSEMETKKLTIYYGIYIILTSGKKVWLVGGILHEDYANSLAEGLRIALGPLGGGEQA